MTTLIHRLIRRTRPPVLNAVKVDRRITNAERRSAEARLKVVDARIRALGG